MIVLYQIINYTFLGEISCNPKICQYIKTTKYEQKNFVLWPLQEETIELIDRHKNESGKIYCTRRKDVDDISAMLKHIEHFFFLHISIKGGNR